MSGIFRLLFGCRHRSLTRPITPAHRRGAPPGRTYVTCLDCGKQFYYDIQAMRVGQPVADDPAPRG